MQIRYNEMLQENKQIKSEIILNRMHRQSILYQINQFSKGQKAMEKHSSALIKTYKKLQQVDANLKEQIDNLGLRSNRF